MEQKELCSIINEVVGTNVSIPTICRLIKKHGITRKQIRTVPVQRVTDVRAHFMSEVLTMSKEMSVWLDETGCDRRHFHRKFGYSLRAIASRFVVRGQRINAIVAISSDGMVEYELHHSSIDSDMIFDFIRGNLIPAMFPFDGSSPRSVLILDNASIHRTAQVTTILRECGILTLFLPAYSPDYNPIEEAFSYVKYYLILHIVPPATILSAAIESITADQCLGWISDSGYD